MKGHDIRPERWTLFIVLCAEKLSQKAVALYGEWYHLYALVVTMLLLQNAVIAIGNGGLHHAPQGVGDANNQQFRPGERDWPASSAFREGERRVIMYGTILKQSGLAFVAAMAADMIFVRIADGWNLPIGIYYVAGAFSYIVAWCSIVTLWRYGDGETV